MSKLEVRSEVFGAVMPHEAAASFLEEGCSSLTHGCDSHATLERLTVSDAFMVVSELGQEGVSYPRWVATAWQVLGWPEPSARVFFEVVWLVTQENGKSRICGKSALDARLNAIDLGLFLLLHGRHDAIALSETPFEEPWIDTTHHENFTDPSSYIHESSPPASPPTSPRGSSSRGGGLLKRASLQLCLRARAAAEASRKDWIVGRAESLLRLAAKAQETGPFLVSSHDIDRLNFIFRGRSSLLSDSCPLFQKSHSKIKKKKIEGQRAVEWLATAVRDETPPLFADFASDHSTHKEHPPNLHTRSYATKAVPGQTIAISDARKCTRLINQSVSDKMEENHDENKHQDDEPTPHERKNTSFNLPDCRIVNCRDARIYILAATRNIEIIGCSDCLIVVGAARSFARVVACERTHVVAAAGRVLLSSCLSCRLSVYTPFAPLLDGDNRGCRLAPFCAIYDGIIDHLRAAGLLSTSADNSTAHIPSAGLDDDNDDDDHSHPSNVSDDDALIAQDRIRRRSRPHPHQDDINLWRSPLRLTSSVHRGCNFARAPLSSESLALHPQDFELVATQFASSHKKQTLPFALPTEYATALQDRQNTVDSIRRKLFSDDRLDANARATLQANARAAFAKWLVDTRAIRHVVELLHLENFSVGAESTGRGIQSPSSFLMNDTHLHSSGGDLSSSAHSGYSNGHFFPSSSAARPSFQGHPDSSST